LLAAVGLLTSISRVSGLTEPRFYA
jgi:hypothetical protein